MYSDLGISGKKADLYVSFSFEKIRQPWLKKFAKKYIFYYSTNKSCYSINEITREHIIGYLSDLSNSKLSVVTKSLRLSSLSNFFNVCYEKGWIDYTKKLIYSEGIPRKPKGMPRYIPDHVLNQLNSKLDEMDPHIRRIMLVLQETGMRINEAIRLKYNCTHKDSDGDVYLKYFQSKLYKDHVIPISKEISNEIVEQQNVINKEWGPHSLLFPIPHQVKSADSDKLITKRRKGQSWTRKELAQYLNDFSNHHEIKDESGQLYRFSFHQFRHTVATKMINNDVPQHIIQRFLGHETPKMTERYAHLMDTTLKEAFAEFNSKMVTISGEVVTPREVATNLAKNMSPEDVDARWLKKNIMAQTLPNGTCALPVVSNSCPHSNACLTCVNFRTDHRHLLTHKQQLAKTNSLIKQAEENGWKRQVDLNNLIKISLEKIISALEGENHDA